MSSGSDIATITTSPSRLTAKRRCCLAKPIGIPVARSVSMASTFSSAL